MATVLQTEQQVRVPLVMPMVRVLWVIHQVTAPLVVLMMRLPPLMPMVRVLQVI